MGFCGKGYWYARSTDPSGYSAGRLFACSTFRRHDIRGRRRSCRLRSCSTGTYGPARHSEELLLDAVRVLSGDQNVMELLSGAWNRRGPTLSTTEPRSAGESRLPPRLKILL